MAGSAVTFASCPSCGIKWRQGWSRCPLCRQLPSEAAVPREPAAPPGRRGVWLFVGAVGALGVVTALTLSGGVAPRTTPAPALVAQAVRVERSPANRRPVPPEIDAGELAARVAADAVRSGNAAYAEGDLERAELSFATAVAAAPDDADARNNLAQVMVRQGRVGEALPHLDEAVRLAPERWAFRFNRGRARGLQGQWAGAVEDYRVAAAEFPDDYVTHYNLGLALMELQRYEAASGALEQAITLAPSEPGFLITLGTAYVGANQQDRARAAFARFLELAPEHGEAPRVQALLTAMDEARD